MAGDVGEDVGGLGAQGVVAVGRQLPGVGPALLARGRAPALTCRVWLHL